ncbi:preprotein translocase subunit SecG [Thermus scotoductus]|jgi:preprotein translocase subunit SecG|uniref:Protein-export membrane protein SecG n=2 Tax=Thermus TaxID=270 RepID=A0A0N0IPL0_THESC|nr:MULTISPECIES: preprotein translocase subunit SecG [Thermus]KPD25499.1 preprotein translocase subunit SecG [Thermus scotoductus]RTG92602.1 preprotein translocase subunit SecG [Thermus scotoductus]RTG97976.1 preprotein translocase subunit SecG [Thermus scotoductus]RTG99319.1 preprotein translocase subunit SecG [Thermus scotoductus]RTH00793.1 preprotein translocase subunit SecG [Thermus scotoductus]
MDFLYTLVILLYLGVAGLLVYLVLVQEPKQGAGDLMGASADLFSARGVTGGLYRLTVILGVIFVALALLIGLWPR